MAVTSIWAVHGSVKDLIDYAENPEKTENPNADELKTLMDYAESPDKTEKRYFVSGVNCLPELAYERMTATKTRYGKCDGIIAYHAYHSFKPGEVTPEQCHKLGVELAKRLWGDRFEVVVASHSDHDHLHNHFVINSVSFKDGLKFRCNKTYHHVLAEASDKLCLEHGLSVIEQPKGKKQNRAAYMAEKKGGLSHRAMLRMDIDDAIADCSIPQYFWKALEMRGYTLAKDEKYKHLTIMADGWKRPVRLSSLGERYSATAIHDRITDQNEYKGRWMPYQVPLYRFLSDVKRCEKYSALELVFMIVLELCGLDTQRERCRFPCAVPLSPAMRQEKLNVSRYMETVNLINRNNLQTPSEVEHFIETKETEMAELCDLRYQIDNYRRRHAKTDEDKTKFLEERKMLTAQIKKLRHDINLAKQILPQYERLKEKIRLEMEAERQILPEQTRLYRKTIRKEELER